MAPFTRDELIEAAGRFARIALECCNNETEVECLAMGIDTGFQLGSGVALDLGENYVPRTFSLRVQKLIDDYFHYYWTGITLGRVMADPSVKNRFSLYVAAIGLAIRAWRAALTAEANA